MEEQVKYARSLVGRQFKHTNGNIYTVVMVTNTHSTPERLKRHPIDVVYIGQNGKEWSRELSDWDRSFTPVDARDSEILTKIKGSIVIWYQMTASHEPEKIIFTHVPTEREVDEYFEDACGGVYKWWHGEASIIMESLKEFL